MKLKDTINLPRTAFSQKANLAQSEPQRLQKWGEMGLYEKIRESRKGEQQFILHDGPPYANDNIHIGTALNKILKDFIVKTATMCGFDSPYVPGYDCHGLPIEKYVEKALAKKGKNKNDLPVGTFRRICREHAAKALKDQTADFQRLGVLGEWDDPYLTMSHEYESETARLFGKYLERGYVYKGARPVYWCVHDQTALAEAEVEYREHTSPSIYVKFPLVSDPARIDPAIKGKNVFVVIWTTTPWTLPANLGITVHPAFDYSAIEVNDEVLIVATELVKNFVEIAGLSDYKQVAVFKGEKLDNLEARHAWLDRASVLMNGDHVTLGGESDAETELDVSDARERSQTGGAGTGCVHTAPGHGHDDFVIGREYGLEIYCPVDNGGRFTDEVEHFNGLQVFEANEKIVEFLDEKGALIFTEDYAHRYPHCWRCKNPVIFRATPQWFISMDAVAATGEKVSLRENALKEINQVHWHPSWGHGRMENMLKGRPDWCVSRQRSWGVPIPVFYCAGCEEEVADPEIVNRVADIFLEETSDAWYNKEASELLPGDFKCGECGGTEFTKETDILDVWFDSGSSCIAVLGTRDNLRFPAEVYIEGGDQYRGWFNSSLMCGLAAHDTAPYRAVLTHGWVVDGEGKKQSKSLGNVTSPKEVIEKSGAEILRLWAAAVDYTEDVRCSDEILLRVVDAYRKFRNTIRFALGNLDEFDPERDLLEPDELQEVDRWALASLDVVIGKVLKGYEDYNFQAVYRTLYDFVTVTLSARYFDIIKDRLYIYAPRSAERRSAQTAVYRIAESLTTMMAPILAFTSDEAYENLPGKRSESVHLAKFPVTAGMIDEKLLDRWERLYSIRDEVLKKLEEARNEKAIGSSLQAKVLLTVDPDTFEFLKDYSSELRYIFIVSQVEVSEGNAISARIAKADGEKCERCWNFSTQVGDDSRYPTVCERCVEALDVILAAEDAVRQ
ncbi:MAG: isoleucine--tRNA ligase [Acidobacteria bacterium]|nr:MAG: isoleucine--tRNA ligase [Acidobacteriota bacterium]REJ99357.1 MAG: isoleucine--tRNA ligase [Acidobacteriota bacterium]REK16473.1 MAG: isoleucine--tRNA ligase [Acidobacteriota bacterium]REK44155.1 MAG: isoleucine--tRNA ligase [Acidobacteriota bacterium]